MGNSALVSNPSRPFGKEAVPLKVDKYMQSSRYRCPYCYELWKPYLRAMMECDMKAVSIGTKRKAEVLETCLQQMKTCFLDARTNKGKLFEAMAIFFERSNQSSGGEQQAVGDVVRRCGLCLESDMVLRKKPDGNFMVGCLGYPQVGAFPVILFNAIVENLHNCF
ncbi:DNA topoisomerase 3-alpha [Datura stramonium]|uniref:DNA topoisomerase n=1 Tax=Datura stramonium TaxID=4076 RepID=A0ABS8TN95_DATST|nr:DNA topoisomerase 3-alpha [Datura stramonium]